MKNTTMLAIIGMFILGAGYFIFVSGNGNGNAVVTNGNGEVQKVSIGMKDYNYYPNTIKVKAGEPVEITLDKSVSGCLRSFTIRDFGVNQYSKSPDEKIKFTPDKKGTFTFACSMGMAYGKIIVE